MIARTIGQAAVRLLLTISILLFLGPLAHTQAPAETLLSTDNAYNPIPSPDGKLIAYVRTGWGRPGGSRGFGRSNLVSDVVVIDSAGAPIRKAPLSNLFLSGWTPEGSRLVCYRDRKYALISRDGTKAIEGCIPDDSPILGSEWVSFSPYQATMVWMRKVGDSLTIIESPQKTIASHARLVAQRVVPSPDGRYFAVFGEAAESHLWVYDAQLETWTDLAEIRIHPDSSWSYIQPSWNPWFADGSRLAYFSDSVLTISSPDGRQKTEIRVEGEAGLPAPLPDGLSVAFVTFEPRPMLMRPDLSFWGNSTIWVISSIPGSRPRAVTRKNPDETYDLRWLNKETLVFDRIADEPFYQNARLWKASVPP